MLIIVRPTSGVQSSAVVCHFARVFVITRRIIIIITIVVVVVIITGYTRRHRCCSCRGRWKNERRRTEEKETSAYWETVQQPRSFPVYSFYINDRPPTAGRPPCSPYSLAPNPVHGNTHFHTFFPPYV